MYLNHELKNNWTTFITHLFVVALVVFLTSQYIGRKISQKNMLCKQSNNRHGDDVFQ